MRSHTFAYILREPDLPTKDLLINGWHPILWKGARRPAKTFKNIPGVTWYEKTITSDKILPVDDENAEIKTHSIYNLQFDHDGLFVANGLTVQAVSPYSNLLPLKEELYFDKSNIRPLTWESHIVDTPWDITDVNSL